jgi:acetylornithine deacetylase/succinyl-diaminopimelate desuccinylase-like protein
VALEAINSIVEEGIVLHYNLIFAATADEETGSHLGLIPLLEKGILKPDAAVVLDADDFNIIIEQKGLLHIKVKLQGERAHGAYPWRGVNAIDAAIDIIKELKAEKFPYAKNKYLRPPTINIGTIKGGDKVNIVADWCEFELDFRFLPGMSARKLINRIRKIIHRRLRSFKIEIESLQEPYRIGRTHPLVAGLQDSMRRLEINPQVKGSEGATVITIFGKKNIPAVACGFGCAGCAHAANEYIGIKNLYRGALLLEDFLKNYRFNN